jgi:hypothetical protein
MATSWSVSGEYMEACSCDFLCPCIPKNSTTPATLDFCKVALAFEIRGGSYGATSMEGVRFVLVAQSKAIMSHGDWIGGLIIDSSATDEQVAGVAAIAGAAGNGPLAMFAPMISDFRGVERAAIKFVKDNGNVSVVVDGMLDQSIVGVESMVKAGEFVCIDNAAHPVNTRLNFATAVKNVISCFGIEWEDKAAKTNGHFAPFNWQGEAA